MGTESKAIQSEPGAQGEPTDGKPRRRWLKIAAAVLTVGSLALIAGAFYIQTEHAFQNFILPVARKASGGELKIGRGHVTLGGSAQFIGVSFVDEASGLYVLVDEVNIEADPMSFIFGDRGRVRLVQVRNLDITLQLELEGLDAEDPGREARPDNAREEEDGAAADDALRIEIPIDLEKLTIEGLSVSVVSGEVTQFALNGATLAVDGLERGRTASIKADGTYEIAPGDASRSRVGTITATLTVNQEGIDGGSSEAGLTVQGNLRVAISRPAGSGGAPAPQLDFEAHLDSTVGADGAADGELRLTARRGGKGVGQAVATAHYAPALGEQEEVVRVALELSRIGPEFVNPLIAAYTEAQFESGLVDAMIEIHKIGGTIEVDSDVHGRLLSIRATPDEPATPQLEVKLIQAATWDSEAEELTVTRAELEAIQDGVPLISARLDEPMTLRASAAGEQADDATAVVGASEQSEARLTIEVSGLSVEQARPWMAVAGSDALDQVEAGKFTATIGVQVADGGDAVEFSTTLDIEKLLIRTSGDDGADDADGVGSSVAMAGEIIGPFAFKFRGGMRLDELTKLTFKSGGVRMGKGRAHLGAGSIRGTIDLETGAMNLRVTADTENITQLAIALGIHEPADPKRIARGELSVTQTLSRADADAPLAMATGIRFKKIVLTNEFGESIVPSMEGKLRFVVNAEFTELELEDLTARIIGVGRNSPDTLIKASGHWPLVSPDDLASGKVQVDRGGEMTLSIRGLDAAPYIGWMHWAEEEALGQVPVEVDWKITMDARGEKITFDGEERIGPVELAGGEASGEKLNVKVQNRFEKLDKQIRGIVLDLAGGREGGSKDHVRLTGDIELGERPRVKLRGEIESLDAGFLSDLQTAIEEEADAGSDEDQADSGDSDDRDLEPPDDGSSLELPFDLDAELKIERLVWRELEITALAATAKGTGGALTVEVEPFSIAGGTLQGTFDLDVAGDEPAIRWNAKATGVQAGPVLDAFAPQMQDPMTGDVTFATSGDAHGTPETVMDNLNGVLKFAVTDGRLFRLTLLEYIAEATGIDEFNNMIFDTFDGDIVIERGVARFDNINATGNLTQLSAEGWVDLSRETLDVAVVPRLGPRLADKLGKVKYAAPVLETLDGFTTLPMAITVKGTFEDQKFGVALRSPEGIKKAGDLLSDIIGGTASGVLEGGKGVKDALEDSVKGLLGSFGLRKGDDGAESRRR